MQFRHVYMNFRQNFSQKKNISPFQKKKTLAETVNCIPKGLRKGNPFHGPFAQLSYMSLAVECKVPFLPPVLFLHPWSNENCHDRNKQKQQVPLHPVKMHRLSFDYTSCVRFSDMLLGYNSLASMVGFVYTLRQTNSSHLKMDGWNTSFQLGWPIFRCFGC